MKLKPITPGMTTFHCFISSPTLAVLFDGEMGRDPVMYGSQASTFAFIQKRMKPPLDIYYYEKREPSSGIAYRMTKKLHLDVPHSTIKKVEKTTDQKTLAI